MEAVRAFNNELSSLYEVKPPISRAKMATVTKTAIKAIKYYKHVVQSIEKFIQKCKPEYKVPGLYVIDSVVRQSRHQFGSNKDMFAPRFTKNIITTFQNLFKCPENERSKIVRVLNLWQKNEVFPSEIVQPLLDLAADPTKPANIAAAQTSVDRWLAANGKPAGTQPQQSQPSSQASNQDEQANQSAAESMLATQNDMLNTVTQLLQHTNSSNAQQQQLQHLQTLQQRLVQQTQLMQPSTGAGPIIDPNLLAQIQTLTNQLLTKTEPKTEDGGFNKKLLDFDYGESDDDDDKKQPAHENNMTGNVQNILNDPSLMQQIHQVSKSIQKNEEMKSEMDEERRRVLEQQQAEFDQQIAMGSMPPHHSHHQPPPMQFDQPPPHQMQQDNNNYREEGEYEEDPNDDDFRDHHQLKDRDEREGRRDRRRRSRSRSRSPKRRRRTRSRSRDRRRRSKSKERHKRSRSKDREREKQKEKERERRRKSLPPMKERHVAICTTTIWIGHLNKFTSEEELKNEIERYGPVQTINMVPPRGCAYIVMQERKDAAKAIDRLKGYKLNGSALKTAWAQSKGIRESDFKDCWDVDIGAMYVPWERLPSDLTRLLEGAIVDTDSLPDNLKDVQTEKPEQQAADGAETTSQVPGMPDQNQTTQPQMPPQPPILGMMQPGMPPQMPGMMPGMMMPMQRPLVPGMPPQALGMAPSPMMPGAARPGAPPLPGVRPPGSAVAAISLANTTTASITQTIQNMLPTSAALVGSPAGPPRHPMGFPPRFGFNPNMPPPGFRMPPPGFPPHMMPAMPPSEDKPDDAPNKEGPSREMIWPPDSNEKDDDDMDEDEPEGDKDKDSDKPDEPSGFKPVDPFGRGPMPPGFPLGGPPGPPQPWNISMRIRGPRPMRFPMGMPPDMFTNGLNRPPMMGGPPMGPPFPHMGMGPPGFPRFPPGMGPPGPRPISLLDLDIKPPPRFSEENQEGSDEGEDNNDGGSNNEEPNEGDGDREERYSGGQDEQGQDEDEEEQDIRNSYPFNSWQSVNRHRQQKENKSENRDDNEDRDHGRNRRHDRGWGDNDEGDNRGRRDNDEGENRGRRDNEEGENRGRRDNDDGDNRGRRDNDEGDSRGRRDNDDGDNRGRRDNDRRDWDRDRDRGERDWGRDRDRDSRDWRRRDERRDRDRGDRGDRGDRDRGREDRDREREGGHRRQRKSRWGDPLDIENTVEEAAPPVLERENMSSEGPNYNEDSVNDSVNEIPKENTSEEVPSEEVNDHPSDFNPYDEENTNNENNENNEFDNDNQENQETEESGMDHEETESRHMDMDTEESLQQTEDNYNSDSGNVNGENVQQETPQDEGESGGPPPLDLEETSEDPEAPSINGPESIEDSPPRIPNKSDMMPDLGTAELPQENVSQTDSDATPPLDNLEDGELDS